MLRWFKNHHHFTAILSTILCIPDNRNEKKFHLQHFLSHSLFLEFILFCFLCHIFILSLLYINTSNIFYTQVILSKAQIEWTKTNYYQINFHPSFSIIYLSAPLFCLMVYLDWCWKVVIGLYAINTFNYIYGGIIGR